MRDPKRRPLRSLVSPHAAFARTVPQSAIYYPEGLFHAELPPFDREDRRREGGKEGATGAGTDLAENHRRAGAAHHPPGSVPGNGPMRACLPAGPMPSIGGRTACPPATASGREKPGRRLGDRSASKANLPVPRLLKGELDLTIPTTA